MTRTAPCPDCSKLMVPGISGSRGRDGPWRDWWCHGEPGGCGRLLERFEDVWSVDWKLPWVWAKWHWRRRQGTLW